MIPAEPTGGGSVSGAGTGEGIETDQATDQVTDQATETPPAATKPARREPVELPELEDDRALSRLVEEMEAAAPILEASVHPGTITEIGERTVSIDLGSGVIGTADRDEFLAADGTLLAEVGAQVTVYVEAVDRDTAQVSKEWADRLAVWDAIDRAARQSSQMSGVVTGRTRGGLTVDIGVRAFLPGSQVDLRAGGNLDRYVGQQLDFEVLRFDKRRGNIVLSRRTMLEKERAGLRDETLKNLRLGAVMPGIVKSLTDYGCFVDLGGIDGLLHITDMSWGRLSHPKHMVSAGDEIQVQVLQFDPATEKVKLGLKQLTTDPWLHVDQKYRVGQRIEGRVVSLTEYGAFVEMEDGVEGLVHVSEMSWTRRIKHPKELVRTGQEIEAVVLGIDMAARRISLGMKQAQPNPWTLLRDKLPVGSRIKAKIKSVTNFGVFMGVEEGIDGLIHVSDLSWGNEIKDPRDVYKAGDELEAVVLHIDVEAERCSLGLKQLSRDPWHDMERRYPIGQIVEGTVKKVLEFGAIVELEPNVEALVHVSELREERVEDPGSVVEAGQTVRAKVISVDAHARKMGLSIKRLIEAELAGDMAELKQVQAPTRLTLGDLIKEKIDVSSLPPGPSGGDAD